MSTVAAVLYLLGMVMTKSYVDTLARIWPERWARYTPAQLAAARWICTALWVVFGLGFFVNELYQMFRRKPTWPR